METWMVTGVNGFLGCRIVERLRKEPERRVLAMTREEMDFTEEKQVFAAFEKYHPDVLVHSGAVSDTGACERDPEGTAKVNVYGTEALARAAGEYGTKMIFMSSDQVYVGSKIEEPHRESETLSPGNVYGRQKLAGEELVEKYTKDGVSLRLTWMYDLPGHLPVKLNFPIRLLNSIRAKEPVLFSDKDYRGFTDARLVAAYLEQCRNFPKGSYHFGSPNPKSTYETAREILSLFGKEEEALAKELPESSYRNLAFCAEKTEKQGVFFPDSIEGIKNCLKDYHYL